MNDSKGTAYFFEPTAVEYAISLLEDPRHDLREQAIRVLQSGRKPWQWAEDDKPLPEDEEIQAAHPLRTNEVAAHKTHATARRLVGAKRSKFALVDLVNWLLVRIERLEQKTKQD